MIPKKITDICLNKRGPNQDITIATALFLAGLIVGMIYVSTWGRTALFYQYLFGPPAMYACGQGYLNPDLSQAPKLNAFLSVIPAIHAGTPPAIAHISKDDIPPHTPTKPFAAIQKREFYLLGSVALLWRTLGIAWSSITPLFGLFYATSITAAYGLFRLGMRRPFALLCSILFLLSPIHLEYLPWLRDYSKAPFILTAVFLTGFAARYTLTPRILATLSALCGIVIGIGIGFRIDVLICIPPFIIVVLFFLPPENRPSWPIRITMLTLFLATFALSSWPILTTLGEGGNKSHPAILGLMAPFSQRLGVGNVSYELGCKYLDAESLALVNAYARHLDPTAQPVMYETPPFEHLADAYAFSLVKTFPADILIRTQAAVLRVLEELRAGPDHILPLGVTNSPLTLLYKARFLIEHSLLTHTRYVAILVLALLAARSLRLATLLFTMVYYFAGYSAVQYGARNCFHLEVIPLWLSGCAAAWTLRTVSQWLRPSRIPSLPTEFTKYYHQLIPLTLRIAGFGTVAILLTLLPLLTLRGIQHKQVSHLFQAYRHAERDIVPIKTQSKEGTITVRPQQEPDTDTTPWPVEQTRFETEFLVAEFDLPPKPLPFRVRYLSDCFETDLTWDATIPTTPPKKGTIQIYFPVYKGSWTEYLPQWFFFRGIEIAEADWPYFKGLYRIRSANHFPIMVHAILPPEGQPIALFQTLTR